MNNEQQGRLILEACAGEHGPAAKQLATLVLELKDGAVNPENGALKDLFGQWHKLLGAYMGQAGEKRVTLGVDDFDRVSGKVVVAQVQDPHIHIMLVSSAEAADIVEHHRKRGS